MMNLPLSIVSILPDSPRLTHNTHTHTHTHVQHMHIHTEDMVPNMWKETEIQAGKGAGEEQGRGRTWEERDTEEGPCAMGLFVTGFRPLRVNAVPFDINKHRPTHNFSTTL